MSATKPRLVILLLATLVWSSITVSSAVQDLVVVQCKNQCKHELVHNKKSLLEDRVDLYRSCMRVCPKTKSLLEIQEAEERFDGIADSVCDERCSSYTEPTFHKRCMNKCYRSLIGKRMKNEAICESSCTVIQEKPFILKCIRVCHERVPGGNGLSS